MRKTLWLLQAGLFYLGTWLVALVPQGLADRLASPVGMLLHRVLASRRRVAEQNIDSTLEYMRSQPEWSCPLPDAAAIAAAVFQGIGRSLLEVCRLYHGRGATLIGRIDVRGREHFEAACALDKGLVFLTGHCSNWELGALAFGKLFNVPVSVVARRQNNPYLNRMVERMRMSYDNSIIYKQNALRNMLSVIRKKGVVGLLVDQAVLPEEGCLISFLGRPAWASRVPVVLARKTGVPVLPVFMYREGDRYVIDIQPMLVFSDVGDEAAVQADVQRYSAEIERFIVRHPTDWYWVHRRWKRTEGL